MNPAGTLSTQEVATVLAISHPTLLKLLREKKIPEPPRVGVMRAWSPSDIRHAQVMLNDLHESGALRRRRGMK